MRLLTDKSNEKERVVIQKAIFWPIDKNNDYCVIQNKYKWSK